MKSNREILDWLNRCKRGGLELKRHLNTIEQIKLDMMMSNQKVSTVKSNSSQKMNPDCQTAESIHEDRRFDYQSQNEQQNLRQEPLRFQRKLQLQEFSYGKQDSEVMDDIFMLSLTDQSNQNYGTNKDFYESITQNIKNFETYQEQQLRQSLNQIEQKINQIQNHNSEQKKDVKTFDQYYQEYVEDEIHTIQYEIQEMQKFLKRVQTAKDKLTSSVQDLSYQNSQRSMQKLNQELDIIQTLRNNMQIQLQNNVDGDKLQRLKQMKQQIQECFNVMEEEIIKLTK